jgi:hypothetical protein
MEIAPFIGKDEGASILRLALGDQVEIREIDGRGSLKESWDCREDQLTWSDLGKPESGFPKSRQAGIMREIADPSGG